MSPQDAVELSWPRYPSKISTLLALVGGMALITGIGILVGQRWLTGVGYLLGAAFVIYHLVAHYQVRRQRHATLLANAARLVSHCKQLGATPTLQPYFAQRDDVVLMLTDDALHLFGDSDPLDLFTSIPLYEIAGVGHSDTDRGSLELLIEAGRQRPYLLRFNHFEPTAPASAWVTALQPRQSSQELTA